MWRELIQNGGMKLQNLGRKLMRLREHTGLSVRETARRFGVVSDTTYGRWEAGLVQPSLAEGQALAAYWGVDVSYLADDDVDEPPHRAELPHDEKTALSFYRDVRERLGETQALKHMAKLATHAVAEGSPSSADGWDHVATMHLHEAEDRRRKEQRRSKNSEGDEEGKDKRADSVRVPRGRG